MKIAHVCPYYIPAIGGVKQVVEELATRQISAGNIVHVITSDWDKEKRIEVKDEVIDGINVHRCHHYLKVSDFSTVWPGVYKKLIDLHPDVIHAHVTGHLHAWLAMKAARKLNVPFVVTTHCPWESKRSFMGKVANYISYNYFHVLCFVSAVIAITPWEHSFLKEEGVLKRKIHTIPNGMATEFFKRVRPNKFKEKYLIPKFHKVVLFFGRLNYTKNPLMFLDIAEAMLHKRTDVTFCIVGPDEGELAAVKKKLDSIPERFRDNIRLLPPTRNRTEVVEMYQAADVYLLPSRREGLPLTLFEAYASGLPVVASAVNGIPYELKNKVNGFLLDPKDFNGFVEKTELLLDDDNLRKQIAMNNIFKSIGFDWDLISKRTMDVYKKALTSFTTPK